MKAGGKVETCWTDIDYCTWIAMLRGCRVSNTWKIWIPVPVPYSPLSWETWGSLSPNLTEPACRALSLAHTLLSEKLLQTLIALTVKPPLLPPPI